MNANTLNDGVRDSHLPEGYDLSLEPIARYRLRRETEYRPLSGFGYVVARLDDEAIAGRVLIAGKSNCDHGTTICDGQTETGSWCVDEWQYDWNLLWSRTAGGRRLISAVGVDHDKYQNPNHPARKFKAKLDQTS
jgi:hypothetical protein